MSRTLAFTGERYLPEVEGEIAHEHQHRYAFARRLVAGRRVLDVACGEGYGTALLAAVAGEAVGVDLSDEAVAHAREKYGARANLRFEVASATALPLPDASVDAVVSFETLEHLAAGDQARMVAEFARVLAPRGVLLLSAPNPDEYSTARNYRNPYHLHEPARAELEALLAPAFPATRWYRQRRYFGSALWAEDDAGQAFEALCGDAAAVAAAAAPPAMYHLVVGARAADDLPPAGLRLSLFSDRDERELRRLDAQAAEVLRLDGLLRDRDAALDRQTAHVRHLEELVASREAIVVERDAQIAALDAGLAKACGERDEAGAALASARQAVASLRDEVARLERALAAQERIIAYRQSAGWWLRLPFLRARLWWQRHGGAR